MRTLFVLSLYLIANIILAQCPFDKYPAIPYKEYKNWVCYDKVETEKKLHHTLSVPEFYGKDSLTVQLTLLADENYSLIRIFKNKDQLQKITEPNAFYSLTTPLSVYVADFNSDSLMDIKFLIPNHGCGGYNYYVKVVYLLQKTDGTFTVITYTDLFLEFENRVERDFDGDRKYEVITQTFKNVKDHNYWVFNLYDFENRSLVNVNKKDDYPIMLQLLYSGDCNIPKNISRAAMKAYAMKLPDEYNKQ